jgi:hypothetical protein
MKKSIVHENAANFKGKVNPEKRKSGKDKENWEKSNKFEENQTKFREKWKKF